MPSYGNSPEDAITAIELIRSRAVSVDKMITHKLSLAETGVGFRLVAAGGDSLKVIINPQSP